MTTLFPGILRVKKKMWNEEMKIIRIFLWGITEKWAVAGERCGLKEYWNGCYHSINNAG